MDPCGYYYLTVSSVLTIAFTPLYNPEAVRPITMPLNTLSAIVRSADINATLATTPSNRLNIGANFAGKPTVFADDTKPITILVNRVSSNIDLIVNYKFYADLNRVELPTLNLANSVASRDTMLCSLPPKLIKAFQSATGTKVVPTET